MVGIFEVDILDDVDIFDPDSWWKEPYPNKAGNALDDDVKNPREKNKEISWAYVVIEKKQPLQLTWLKAN